MHGKSITKKFFDRMRRVAVRLEDTHLTELSSFAKNHDLLEASQSEIIKAYIENRIAQGKIDVQICDLGLLDIDSKGEPRCRLKNNPYADTTNWTENACIMCRNQRNEQIEIQMALGRTVTRKNVGVVLAMAKKYATAEEEITSKDKSLHFYKREIGLRNDEVSRLTRQLKGMSSQAQALASEESKIASLTQKIETLETTLNSAEVEKKSLLEKLELWNTKTVNCPIKGIAILLKECFSTCDKFIDCPFFGALAYSET